jgi:hypothetical protein
VQDRIDDETGRERVQRDGEVAVGHRFGDHRSGHRIRAALSAEFFRNGSLE